MLFSNLDIVNLSNLNIGNLFNFLEIFQAIEKLKKGENAVEAIATAIKFLEQSAITNAGYGSSLTLEGNMSSLK